MAKLIAQNPQTVALHSVGYHGEPEGVIDITQNGQYDVKSYASADVNVPNLLSESPDSEKPAAFGADDHGVYISDNTADMVQVAYGRDLTGIFMERTDES